MTSLEQHLAAHWLRNSTSYGPDGGNLADEDDLATICQCGHRIAETLSVDVESLHAAHVADAWRESRTVRTVDELDALPNGSIYVSDAEGLAEQKAGDVWFAARCAQPFEPVLPGVVVHRPDEDGAQ